MAINRAKDLDWNSKGYAIAKVMSISTAFEEKNADPRVIAKQTGFKDYKGMVYSMKNKGYEWNAYKNNYIKAMDQFEEFIKNSPQIFSFMI